jgi:hypothetical protein
LNIRETWARFLALMRSEWRQLTVKPVIVAGVAWRRRGRWPAAHGRRLVRRLIAV